MQTPEVHNFYTCATNVPPTFLTPTLCLMTQVIRPAAEQKGRVVITVGYQGPYQFSALCESSLGGSERGSDVGQMTYDINVTLQASMDPQLLKLTMDTLFQGLRQPEVSLEFDSDEGMRQWKTWMTTVPNVHKLRLYDYPGQVVVLKHLASRGKDGWLCPTLAKFYISLGDYRCLSAVLDLVKNRYRNHQDEAEEGRPKPLEILVLAIAPTAGIPDTALEEIKRVLGHEQVVITRASAYPW